MEDATVIKENKEGKEKGNQHLCLIILDKWRWNYSNWNWIYLLENFLAPHCLSNSEYVKIYTLWDVISGLTPVSHPYTITELSIRRFALEQATQI